MRPARPMVDDLGAGCRRASPPAGCDSDISDAPPAAVVRMSTVTQEISSTEMAAMMPPRHVLLPRVRRLLGGQRHTFDSRKNQIANGIADQMPM